MHCTVPDDGKYPANGNQYFNRRFIKSRKYGRKAVLGKNHAIYVLIYLCSALVQKGFNEVYIQLVQLDEIK